MSLGILKAAIPGLSWLRLAGVGIVVLALAASHWKAYSAGYAASEAERAKEKAAQANAALETTRANAATSIRNADNVIEAQNEATRTQQTQAVIRNRLADTEQRLRDAIAAAGSAAANAAPDACAQRAATVSELFGECRNALAGMAGKADNHARDSLMYQQAWPK